MVKKETKIKKPERTQTGGLDYSVYYMSHREYILNLLIAAISLFLVGYIFYRSVLIAAFIMIFAFKYPSIRTKHIIASRRKDLTVQFKDMLYSLSSSLSSGNSVESSMVFVLEDMERQYVNKDTYIIQELQLINAKLALNANIEDLLIDLANRSGIDDIRVFANIFEISKRTGGNLVKIVRQSTDIIGQKIETKMEIETLLAEKKMEAKILTIMPIALVFLLTETTGDFMAPLFNTLSGRMTCTFALLCIVVGNLIGKKLTDIKI